MEENLPILVTGGAGYVGSHTVRVLLEAGWHVVVFDNLSTGHSEALPDGIPLERGDLGRRAQIEEVLVRTRPWAVIHFAGSIEAGESMVNPAKYYRNNVANTLNLLDAMRSTDTLRMVFSSSAGVYGAADTIPIPETAPRSPVNTYGATKAVVERMLEDYGRAHGLTSIALRYFNAAGAHPSGDIGEAHPSKTHLVEVALLTLLGRFSEITVFGTDYPTPDGTAVRDYIHVDDLANAHVAALEALYRAEGFRAYNVGLGKGFSVLDILDTVERVTGRHLPRTTGPRRPGDPPVLIADPARIRRELGWRPEYEDIATIVETAWRWHRSHPNDYDGPA